jgi:hypothetical protein
VYEGIPSYGSACLFLNRFMQLQPSLINLGKARLKLLERFYLRSLQRQTSDAYISIIRTDPKLDPNILDGLISALKISGIRHVLIASNTEPKSYFDDIMLQGGLKSSQILSGLSLDEVKKFLQGPTNGQLPPKVLETRLDADDGLHIDFVRTIQDEIIQNFNFNPRTWKIWCVGKHTEWQADMNFINTNNRSDDPALANPGSIFLRPKEKFCVTPGMSIAFLGERESIDASRGVGHHYKVFKQHKLCSTKQKRNQNCIHFLPIDVAAFRARTPTSAGMMDVVIEGGVDKKYKKIVSKQNNEQQQSKIWRKQEQRFGFTRRDGRDINAFFYQNIKGVAEDALVGQCTAGHSCKKSSQATLKKILATI